MAAVIEASKGRENRLTMTTKSTLSRLRKADTSSKTDIVKEREKKTPSDFCSKLRSKQDAPKKDLKSLQVTTRCKRKRGSTACRKRRGFASGGVSSESTQVQPQHPRKRRRTSSSQYEKSSSKELEGAKESVCDVSNLCEKTRGADGYFFECVVCDIGGNLLCCDKCPRTYHLECLDPPLKRTPPGKWHCPVCRGQISSPIISTQLPSTTKKARSSRRSEECGSLLNQKECPKHIKKAEADERSIAVVHLHQKRKESSRKKNSKKSKVDNGECEKVEYTQLSSFIHSEVDQKSPDLALKDSSPCRLSCKEGSMEAGSSHITEPEELITANRQCKNVKESPRCVKLEEEDLADNNTNLTDGPSISLEVDRILGCRVVSSVKPSVAVAKMKALEECCAQRQTGLDGQKGSAMEVNLLPALQRLAVQSCGEHESGSKQERISVPECKQNQRVQSAVESFIGDHEGSPASGKLVNIEDNLSVADLNQRLEDVGADAEREALNDLSRSTDEELSQNETEFLVKWVGRSHIHNEWITESTLKSLSKSKLDNYKFKYGTSQIVLVDEKWSTPQRIVARRKGHHDLVEVLVKWCGLPYDECTWESLNEPIIQKCPELLERFELFEAAARKSDNELCNLNVKPGEVDALVEQPKELKGGSLFPHQMEALNWLRKCWRRKKNVILADEMGLGKTVSAISFISSLYVEFNVKRPCMVLVPLSTMPNWMEELSAWSPHVNVVEYHGSGKARAMIREYEWHAGDTAPNREVSKSFKFNVLLTTYEMVLADASQLRAVPWEVLVVDEGHRLKNTGSKLFQLLNTLSFSHRVLLTGSPLQNNSGEMYSLLNFLQPDAFPSLTAFEEKFNNLNTTEQIEELKKMVAPHMLQRLKKDAMQNIPPKTERVVPVELTCVQAEYYRAVLTRNYQVLRQAGKAGQHKSLVNIVVQLRKVCNHPYLIPGTEPETGSAESLHEMRIKASAKLTLLHLMLKSLKKQGHRVLIFSQMTKLLDILEDYLMVEYGSHTFERVDGSISVAQRQAAISRFNQDTSRFVFLLSTRACGLGINLATADTVIIYDSDFNPHADIQAMNRAHRIGQSKRLLVYRLVVRASVEERILQLAKKKLMLDHLFANKSGSQKDVEDILRWGTGELFQDSSVGVGGTSKFPSSGAVVDGLDGKQKKQLGGLGDVYEDTCHHKTVQPKVSWDDASVTRLLDCSDLGSESIEREAESDILGSLKAWDWNDQENPDEQEPTEREADSTGDTNTGSGQGSEEESSWDRILRWRWEKLQDYEEGSLGQGKRMRKAVSYKENIDAITTEALFESDDEYEEDAEPEYTPAGRALKDRLSRLRARQKERIAARCNQDVGEMLESPLIGNNLAGEKSLPDDFKSTSPIQLPGIQTAGKNCDCDSFANGLKFSPNAAEINASLAVDSMSQQDTSETAVLLSAKFLTSTDEANLSLPVNEFQQSDSIEDKTLTTSCPQEPGVHDSALLTEPIDRHAKNLHIESSAAQEQSDHYSVETLPGGIPQNNDFHAVGLAGDSHQPLCEISEMELSGNLQTHKSCLNLNMSLGPGESSGILDTLSAVRSAKSGGSVASTLLSQMPESLSTGASIFTKSESGHICDISIPKKSCISIKDDLQTRTQTLPFLGGMASRTIPAMDIPTTWTEEELDALWSGVRRYGRGNWVAMLGDPKLFFSKSKTAKDLASRWADEQLKVFGGSFDISDTLVSGEPSRPVFNPFGAGLLGPLSQKENLFSSGQLRDGLNLTVPRQTQGHPSLSIDLERFCPWQSQPERSSLPLPQINMELRSIPHIDTTPNAPTVALKEEEKWTAELGHKINLPRFAVTGLPSSAVAPKTQGDDLFNNPGFAGKPAYVSQTNTQSPQFFHGLNIPDPIVAYGMSRGPQGDGDWNFSNLQLKFGKGTQIEPIELPKLGSFSDTLPVRLPEFGSFANKLKFRSSDMAIKPPELKGAGLPLSGLSSLGGLSKNFTMPAVLEKKPKTCVGTSHSSTTGNESLTKPSCLSNLPHWLREAFKPPALIEPALPSTIAAVSQAMDLVYWDSKSILPVWVNPGSLPVLPPRKSKRRRKKRGSGGRRPTGDASTMIREQPGNAIPSTKTLLGKKAQSNLPALAINSKLVNGSFVATESRHSSLLVNLPSSRSYPWTFGDQCDKSCTPFSSDLPTEVPSLLHQSLSTSTSDSLQGAFKSPVLSFDQYPFISLDSLPPEGINVMKPLDEGDVQHQWPMFGLGTKENQHSRPQSNMVQPPGPCQQVASNFPGAATNSNRQGTTSPTAETDDSSSKTQSDPCIHAPGQHKCITDDVSSEQTISDCQTRE